MTKTRHPVRLETRGARTKMFIEPMTPDPRKLIVEEAMFARAVIVATGFVVLAGFVVWTRINEIEALTRAVAAVN
jgi:hypothetical protein